MKTRGVQHYPDFITCDFCGVETRGRIYPEEPDSVKCTACRMELTDVATSVVVDGKWKIDQKRSLHSTDIVTEALNHLANNDLD